MYTIGQFSTLTKVTVKTLRYYDEIGLLKPDAINAQNGYRSYKASQLPRLNRILALKDLGLSLEHIKRVLEGDLSADELRGMLKLRQAELEEQLQEARQQLGRVAARLEFIAQEGKMGHDVILRSKAVEAQRVASVKREITSYEADLSGLFGEMFGALYKHVFAHTQKVGPATAIYHDDDEHKPITLEACLPILEAIPESNNIILYDLPAIDAMACVVHQGSFSTLEGAYQTLLFWLEQHHYYITGPAREVFLHFDPKGNPNDTITEIQLPVSKR